MSYIVILRSDKFGNPIDCREYERFEDAKSNHKEAVIWNSDAYNYVKRGRDIVAHKASFAKKKPWWKFWAKSQTS